MWWTKLRGNRFPFYSNFQSTNYGGGCGSGGGKRRRIKHASVSSPGPTIHRLEKRSEFSCQGHLRSRYGISNCLMDSNKNVGNGSVQQIRMLHLQNGQTPLSEAIPSDLSYQSAVNQLNLLQSNAATLATRFGRERERFLDTWKFLKRSGISPEDLDILPVIHVAGTKGKGSVCSLVESILRAHGLKTGFFSSPHLVSVTERIRLNGTPISENTFAEYFWRVFHRLDAEKESPQDLPPYFSFLTLMAFHVFLAEKVDVAILEVGIGGTHDCTNIVQNTKTVGITSLGLDHVPVLGDTVEKIAAQKAGIIKKHSNVFTVVQPGAANEVIEKVAKENDAHLTIVPAFDEYTWSRPPNIPQITTSVQKLNISLAVQLSMDWKQRISPEKPLDRRFCTEEIITGIERFNWPGRYQIIDRGVQKYYLDGAHTLESLEVCLSWFRNRSRRESFKCLFFFVTGMRDVQSFAKLIQTQGQFDMIVICPNLVDCQATVADNVVANVSLRDLQEKCIDIQRTFQEVGGESYKVPVEVASSVMDALRIAESGRKGVELDVLITGSLYIVGTALIALNQ